MVKPNTCPAEHFFTDSYDEFLAASSSDAAKRRRENKNPNC
ncbi:MAG: hypothetical protein U0R24_13590 [Solirubrobacterales bacterium]